MAFRYEICPEPRSGLGEMTWPELTSGVLVATKQEGNQNGFVSGFDFQFGMVKLQKCIANT